MYYISIYDYDSKDFFIFFHFFVTNLLIPV